MEPPRPWVFVRNRCVEQGLFCERRDALCTGLDRPALRGLHVHQRRTPNRVTAEKKLIKSMVESEGGKSSHSDQQIRCSLWPQDRPQLAKRVPVLATLEDLAGHPHARSDDEPRPSPCVMESQYTMNGSSSSPKFVTPSGWRRVPR